MPLNIRRADHRDFPLLWKIELSCFSESLQCSERSIKHSISSIFQSVWIAELIDINGFEAVGAMILHHKHNFVRVYSIAVLPEYQERGIGFSLLQHAEILANREGAKKLALEVDESNARLVGWYLNKGFLRDKRIYHYYAPDKHALRLSKNLQGKTLELVSPGLLAEIVSPVESELILAAR